ENQNFEDIKERDKAFKIPNDYKAPTFFQSALSHSNTKFTWDMNDPKRDYLLRANSNNDPKIEDYAEFLGSSEENDFLDETINGELKNNKTKNEDFLNDDTKSREKLLSLIKNLKNKKETEEVVVKFQTGFDDKSENENRNDFESAEEKTNQLLENKKKLKKRKRVNAIRKREKKIENEKIKESKGFNLIKEKKKAKNSKTDSKNRPSKNEKSIENSSKSIKNNFEIDLKDKRFEALKKDSNFSIDPSNPQFKKTDQMKNLIRKMNTENETEKRKVEDVSMKSLMKKLKSKLHKND
ncbi:pre-rRNA-processing protein esf1, partial [Bonamia ostreae]